MGQLDDEAFEAIVEGLEQDDADRIVAAATLTGHTGAKGFYIGEGTVEPDSGVVDHDGPGWYAVAEFAHGAMVVHREDPAEACDGLVSGLLEGGTCTHCSRTTTIMPATFYTVSPSDRCHWTRTGNRWTRGCAK